MKQLYRVLIGDAIRETCIGDDETLNVKPNDFCIISCNRYEDFARVVSIAQIDDETDDVRNMPEIKRQATLVDQGKANENTIRSKSMHRQAEKLITKHKLPMVLRCTHLSYDKSLVIFVYTAPGRVDFRELLKDLNKALQIRVELRQVGPRDQAAMVGGLGTCGRELCCSTFLTNFVSINIKMAKTQGLSLNPSNIIGACGRLKCCLEYEYEGYKLLMKSLPRIGARCECQGCDGRVVEVSPLKQEVTVLMRDERVVTVPVDEVKAYGFKG